MTPALLSHLKQRRPWQLACAAVLAVALAAGGYSVFTRINLNPRHVVGEKIDELNGVAIYFNGGINTTRGRNLAADGYNLGIRHQCVEFVKRYYYERHAHRMPDAFGHARDFHDVSIADGGWNGKRAMLQYANGSDTRPQADDLLVFSPWLLNPYGHVAVVASTDVATLEVAQQNPGPFGSTRETFAVKYQQGKWVVDHPRVLGWLRLRPQEKVSTTGS